MPAIPDTQPPDGDKGEHLMRVDVIHEICQGHARCQERCPEVFGTDEVEGKCVILLPDVPPELEHKARLTVKNCPEGALVITSG
jgi:ferredoxin